MKGNVPGQEARRVWKQVELGQSIKPPESLLFEVKKCHYPIASCRALVSCSVAYCPLVTLESPAGDHVTSSSTPQENGEATDEKGKSKIKSLSLISSSADKKHNALTAAALYQSWLRASSDSEDDDDDDEGDESFEGQDESEEGDEDEDAGKEEEEGDEDDEEEEEDEEDEEEDLSMKVMEEFIKGFWNSKEVPSLPSVACIEEVVTRVPVKGFHSAALTVKLQTFLLVVP
uniref:Uncharacterized protein n=1 Tax=Timema monikensis TaxID=170555 RepID=A0A7R9HSZ9_9NEOP|nr:unnamed protein product [Timema monikensis]